MAASRPRPVFRRSGDTFRSSGSSGLVWEDRFLPEDMSLAKNNMGGVDARDLWASEGVDTTKRMERSHSNGGARPFPTGKVSPAPDDVPPSPKISACGFCGIFATSSTAKNPKPRRR